MTAVEFELKDSAVTDRRYNRIGRPDGAGDFDGVAGYKDFASDGAKVCGNFSKAKRGILVTT